MKVTRSTKDEYSCHDGILLGRYFYLFFYFFLYSCSILTDDEDFESNWGIPEEPSDEMEMSRSSVTVRSFGDRYVSEQFCHQ